MGIVVGIILGILLGLIAGALLGGEAGLIAFAACVLVGLLSEVGGLRFPRR